MSKLRAPTLKSLRGGRTRRTERFGPIRVPPAPRDNPARGRGGRVRANPVTAGDLEQLELNPQSLDADMRVLLGITKEDARRWYAASQNATVSEEARRGLALQVYEDAAYAASLWRVMVFYEPEDREDAFARIRDDVKRAMSFARTQIARMETVEEPNGGYGDMGPDPFVFVSKITGDGNAAAMLETIVVILDKVTGGQIVAPDELVGGTWETILASRNPPPRVAALLKGIKAQGEMRAEMLLDRGTPYDTVAKREWTANDASNAFWEEMGRLPMQMEALSSVLAEYFTEGLAEQMGLTMGEQDTSDAAEQPDPSVLLRGEAEERWNGRAWDELSLMGLDEWPESARRAFVDGYRRSVAQYLQGG